MPTPHARCSECPEPIPVTKKTCSPKCRAARSRRIHRQRKAVGVANSLPEGEKAMSQAAAGAVADALHDVAKEELRPVVREAITEDVLRGAGRLVGLVPAMVAAITEDLGSDDKVLRQRAYTLLARYTLGNSSIAPPPTEQAPSPMTVVFQMPRPGDASAESEVPAEAEELRVCVECDEAKGESDFAEGSDRCAVCHAKLRAAIQARYE